MTCLLGECANFIMANGRENAVAAVEIGPQMMGLALGSSSQYSMTASYASTLDPASALLVAAKPRPLPPPAGEGPPPEAPPEGPAGGALLEAYF